MASIAKLVVSLGANTASFETDMKRASRNQQKRMQQMKADAEKAAKGLAVAFVAAAGAMTALVRNTTQTADEMQKLALRTGITTEALSQYKHVAELSGVSFEQFTNGMKRMSRSISDAEVGLSTQTRAFERLGLSVDEIMRMRPDEQFETIAQAMTGLESATLRSATAQEIFGRSGTEMLSLMAYGKEGIQQMREEADKLGITIGKDLADSSALFNDNMTRLKASVTGAGIQLTSGLLPALIGVQEYFLKDAEASDIFSKAGEWLGDVIKRLIAAFIVMKGVAKALGKVLVGVAMVIYNSFKALFLAVKRPIDQLAKALDHLTRGELKAAAAAMGAIPKAMADGWNEGAKSALESLEFIGTGLEDIEESIESAFDLLESEARESQEALFSMEGSFDDASVAVDNFGDTLDEVVVTATKLPNIIEPAMQKSAQSVDLLTTAMDEGIRILERSFTSMWDGLLDGSEDAFDSIKDGFKSLLSSLIHQATTQKIMLNIEQGMSGTGTGANGGINFSQLGGDLAAIGGVLLGNALGGGGAGASIGSALGAIAGQAAVTALSGTWLALGSVGGPIGIALAAVLGGVIGGLFDKPSKSLLDLSGYSRAGVSGSDKDSSFNTAFGTTFVRSRHLKPEAMAEIVDSVTEFDKAIAGFLSDSQLERVTDTLSKWSHSMKAETLTFEEFMDSRFGAILSTFDENIRAFVSKGADMAEQVDRLQVALSADEIINSGVFTGKTVSDFLNVVEAFQDGTETITDAFNEVLELLNVIGAVHASLRDYADSNLGDDYSTIVMEAGMGLSEALTAMQSSLMDAMVDFDGSPEQLQAIGEMVFAIRQGELNLLAQIDQIQQGINANLDTLEAKIRGLTEGEKTAEEIFREANDLIGGVINATDASEIAALEQKFTALINSLTEADQLSLQTPLLNMIEGFREAANIALGGQKDDVLGNGEASRDLVDIFLTDIGDPLDILAASNQDVVVELSNINDTLGDIGPTLGDAIRKGFGDSNINVTVVMSEPGMVNE